MNRNGKPFVKRIMILLSMVMMMALLCGCRTRITNNTEVADVINDENGILSETYQMRRDELGIPIAEPPLFGGSGSDEDSEEYEDYESEEYEEEYDEEFDEEFDEDVEDDTDSGTTTTTPIRTGSSTTPSSHYVHRPTTTTTTTTISVKLDLNGKNAKCSRSSLYVRKGFTYGALPTPTRDGYTFEGWYTAKSKGKKVASTTKVTSDKAHTLYAHWKETKKKKYTITFDGNADDGDEVKLSATEKTVEEGGTYGDMPSAERKKYTFKGWFTEASKGNQVTSKTKFTANKDQTLYAHWEEDKYKWWKNEFSKSANEIDVDSQLAYLIDEDSEEKGDDADSFLSDCRMRKVDEEATPDIIVKFVDDDDKAAEEISALTEKYSESAPDARIIIVSIDALYREKEEKLLYKLTMFNTVYGGDYNLKEARYDLNDGNEASIYTN